MKIRFKISKKVQNYENWFRNFEKSVSKFRKKFKILKIGFEILKNVSKFRKKLTFEKISKNSGRDPGPRVRVRVRVAPMTGPGPGHPRDPDPDPSLRPLILIINSGTDQSLGKAIPSKETPG